jgi:hypothetical protein
MREIWIKLNNNISRFCSSPDIIRVMKSSRIRWEGHVELLEENRYPWRVLGRKSEGNIRLGRTGREGENNNRIYLKEGGCQGLDWIYMGEDMPF